MGVHIYICVLKMYLITTKKGGLCKLLPRIETEQIVQNTLLGNPCPFLRILLKGLRELFSFHVCVFWLQKRSGVNASCTPYTVHSSHSY